MTKPTAKIFIGFKTRPVSNVEAMMPEFTANKTLKDPVKIAADLEEKKAAYLAGAKDRPYTGTFEEVFLIDPSHQKRVQYLYCEPGSKEFKGFVSGRVRNYLLHAEKGYPHAWDGDLCELRKPEAVFIGFEPRTFLKILGEECSMPKIGKPLPPRMWCGNSDNHRDITSLLIPSEHEKFLTLGMVLKERRPLEADAARIWDSLLDGWTGPGVNPMKDAQLSLELSTQLGIVQN